MYVSVTGKALTTLALTAAEIVTQLTAMGWELYDDVPASSYKILRSNGEAGTGPNLYCKIDWSGTTYLVLTGMCAWNNSTHSTTAQTSPVHLSLVANKNLWLYGNKDWFFLMQEAGGTVSANCMLGRVMSLPADAVNTTTTGPITAGSSVIIPVASAAGFLTGARYQIFDPVSGYRQTFTCTGIGSNTITADSIATVGYASSSIVGTHPFAAIVSPGLPTLYCFNAHRHTYNAGVASNSSNIDIIETSDARTYRGLGLAYLGLPQKRRFYPPILTEYASSPSTYRHLGTMDDGSGNFYVCPPFNSTTYGDSFTAASLDTVYMGQIDTGTTTGSNTVTTMNDTSKSWSADEHVGKVLVMTGGTEGGQIRKIISNSATTLTVSPDFAVIPVSGTYAIADRAYRYFLATQGYMFREGV